MPLDTPVVLRSIYEMFEADAVAKGLEFRFVETSRKADIEPLALMRIISNLVGNAIKYTANGKVLLGVRRHEGRLWIEVHDTGPGLTLEEFQTALARDARLERDLTTAEGNGLGLAIAAELAAAHGCKLRLVSNRRNGTGLVLDCPTAPLRR